MKRLITAIIVASMFCAVSAFADNQKYVRPPPKSVIVTPSDATVYNPPLASIYVGTTGAVRMILTEDRGTYDCTDGPIHVGAIGLLRGRVYQVCATGTDASDIVGYPITNSP